MCKRLKKNAMLYIMIITKFVAVVAHHMPLNEKNSIKEIKRSELDMERRFNYTSMLLMKICKEGKL